MWPDAPDWPPHRISILTLAVFSRHTCRHTCHFQHNHYSCPVLLEQCRALKSQARQQSPCLVRTESAALFSSDTDFSPSPTCAKGLRLTVPRSVPAGSRLVSGVLTALVLVLPLQSWRFLRTLSVSVIAGMSLKPSVPGSGRLWDPPSHAGRPCGTPARACTASAWMDQIRGEAVRLMSSEGSAAVYILFVCPEAAWW